MPVYIKTLKGRKRRGGSSDLLRDQSVRADAAPADMSTQVRCFVQFFKWLAHCFSTIVFCAVEVQYRNLATGAKQLIFHQSLQLPSQERVSRALWDFFHKDAQPTHHLKHVWRPVSLVPWTPKEVSRVRSADTGHHLRGRYSTAKAKIPIGPGVLPRKKADP